MRAITFLLSATVLCASVGMVSPVAAETVALEGGTVYPVSGPAIPNGTVVMQDGKILAVGAGVTVPADARRVDVTGLNVYPGLIAAHTVLGLVEINSVRGTRDYSEVGTINPNARAQIALNADSELIPVARANGILTVQSATTGGVIAGTSVVWNLDGWNWKDMTVESDAGIHINWPSMTTSTSWWNTKSEEEQKKEREERLQKITEAFDDARAYLKAREAMASGGAFHELDVRWEAMIPMLKGIMPVYVHADEYQQMEAVLEFVDKQELRKVVIVGGTDSWRLADKLAAAHIPVILNDADDLPRRDWEPYDARFTVASKLHEAGVLFAFTMGGSGGEVAHLRNMPYGAAMAAAYGLPREEALKGVTLNAAQILGVGDRLGSLEVGKDANVIVVDGDPLEIISSVKMAFIGGREVSVESRHTKLYDRYRNRPRTDGKESQLQPAY